jgi:hypothetical protein
MARFDTTALVAQVKAIPGVPDSQALLDDDRILRFANAVKNQLVSLVQSAVEEYFVYSEDYEIDVNNSVIVIPETASGMRLREVYFLDSLGGNVTISIPRRQLEQLGNDSNFFSDKTFSYYLENDKVCFTPVPTETKYIRLYYYRMPNELVAVSEGGIVGDCEFANAVELRTLPPSDWITNLDTDYLFDVISPRAPFNTKATVRVNGISDKLLYIDDPVERAMVSPGDMIYRKGEAPVLQYLPQEAFYVLASGAASYILRAIGDVQGLAVIDAQYRAEQASLLKLISPRTVGSPKKLINRNSVYTASRLSWTRR